ARWAARRAPLLRPRADFSVCCLWACCSGVLAGVGSVDLAMNPKVRPLVLTLFAGALLSEATAEAHCRTKACDTTPSYGDVWDEEPQPLECVRNAQGCYLQGTPLFWSSRCLNFAVQKD